MPHPRSLGFLSTSLGMASRGDDQPTPHEKIGLRTQKFGRDEQDAGRGSFMRITSAIVPEGARHTRPHACRLEHRRHMDRPPWPDRPYPVVEKTQRDAATLEGRLKHSAKGVPRPTGLYDQPPNTALHRSGRARFRAIGERLKQIGQLGVAMLFHEPRHIVDPATAARLADDRQRGVTKVGQDDRAVRGMGSRPHERRVLRLQPAAACPAPKDCQQASTQSLRGPVVEA